MGEKIKTSFSVDKVLWDLFRFRCNQLRMKFHNGIEAALSLWLQTGRAEDAALRLSELGVGYGIEQSDQAIQEITGHARQIIAILAQIDAEQLGKMEPELTRLYMAFRDITFQIPDIVPKSLEEQDDYIVVKIRHMLRDQPEGSPVRRWFRLLVDADSIKV